MSIQDPIMTNSAAAALLSRRSVLAGLSAATLAALAPAYGADTPPPAMKVTGGLIELPAKGTLIIANDFHTRHADFDRWLRQSDLEARLAKGDDVYGLVLGDILDAKLVDEDAEPGGDVKMLARVRKIQAGPNGNRFLYTIGNHEHESCRLYGLLREKGMNAANQVRVIRGLYDDPQYGSYFRQWNSLERITAEDYEFCRKLPVAVKCGNGLFCVHAGPWREAKNADDVAGMSKEAMHALVWGRPSDPLPRPDPPDTHFDPQDVGEFLTKMGGSKLMVVGHTPLVSVPERWHKDGLARVGEQCVIMAASFGALPQQKNYLEIDLSKMVTNADSLRPGKEIVPIKEKQARAAEGVRAFAIEA
jgi:hypothetical protein